MFIKKKAIRINKPIGVRYYQNFIDKLELKHIKSSVQFKFNDRLINAKSIIGLLSMGFVVGNDLELIVFSNNEDIVNMEFPIILNILEELYE